jgi:hypothetical protein
VTEIHSDVRRVEQQLRWHGAKADALAAGGCSARIAQLLGVPGGTGGPPQVDRLLVLRSTQRTRHIVAEYHEFFATVYPARYASIVESLFGQHAWPGSGLVWARYLRNARFDSPDTAARNKARQVTIWSARPWSASRRQESTDCQLEARAPGSTARSIGPATRTRRFRSKR